MTEEVTQPNPVDDKSPLDQLVEAKGNDKFRDPDVLAKSKLEADNHIVKLEAQLKELREEMSTRLTAEEALKALDSKADEIAKRALEARQPVKPDTQFKAGDVEEIVERTIARRTETATRESNLAQANKELSDKFGTDAANVVRTTAASLGLSEQDMVDMAAKSPTAFLTVLGEPKAKETNSMAQREVRTEGEVFDQSNGERNYQYYSDLRKKDLKAYMSPAVQKQKDKDLQRLGDKF